MKYIYNNKVDYDINEVREVEITTDNFETANKLIEERGYYKKKLVEKKRESYLLNNVEIEIDEWPLLNPYIEIEGKEPEEIYEIANLLGYKKAQTRVMNTEDVYIENGINLSDYEEMTFKTQNKI